MTTPQDYSALITSEHNKRPKFVAMVELFASAFSDGQNTLESMPSLYDLDTAAGAQLDTLGIWIGFGRTVFVPGTGTVTLIDADYRTLLRAKVISNHYDGGFESLLTIIQNVFPGTASIYVVDNQDMSIDVFIVGTLTPTQLALLEGGLLVPKPEGVRINGYTVIGSDPAFGLDFSNVLIDGPDVGAFY